MNKNVIIVGLLIITMIVTAACTTTTTEEQAQPEKTYITFDTINVQDVIDSADTTTIEGEPAVIIADLIGTADPENYTYQLVAADGYTPPFYYTYDELQKAYWLTDKKETFFPENNIGKNRIRDLATIKVLIER